MVRANTSLKTCFKCGEAKPRSEFYKHSAMRDGLLGKCKTCTKADVAAHRVANIDKVRAYDSMRAKRPERIKLAAEISRRWRQEDRRRTAAHNKVARAIAKGLITKKPCRECKSEKSMAHHESYDHPLKVVWYCQVHHIARHKQMAIDGIEP